MFEVFTRVWLLFAPLFGCVDLRVLPPQESVSNIVYTTHCLPLLLKGGGGGGGQVKLYCLLLSVCLARLVVYFLFTFEFVL